MQNDGLEGTEKCAYYCGVILGLLIIVGVAFLLTGLIIVFIDFIIRLF